MGRSGGPCNQNKEKWGSQLETEGKGPKRCNLILNPGSKVPGRKDQKHQRVVG